MYDDQFFVHIFISLKNHSYYFFLSFGFLFFLCKKIWMKDINSFFIDDSICDCDLRQQHLVDDHLRMPRVDDKDGDVNEEQNNLLFFTPITSFFTYNIFFSSHWSFSKFANRILSPWFMTRSFSHEAEKMFVALRRNDYYGIGSS